MENEIKNESQPKAKGNGYALVLLLVGILLIGVVFFLTRDDEESEDVDVVDQEQAQDVEVEEAGEVVEDVVETEDEALEVVGDFPEDIPVLEGEVVRSEIQEFMAITEVFMDVSVEEAFGLYEEAFEDTDWIIQETNETDEYHDIIFNNGIDFGEEGHRSGRVVMLYNEDEGKTSVTIRENY